MTWWILNGGTDEMRFGVHVNFVLVAVLRVARRRCRVFSFEELRISQANTFDAANYVILLKMSVKKLTLKTYAIELG